MIRDPVTKETVIPFETRPTKSDEMKNLAWEKIHQEALGHFQGKNLKLTDMSQNSLIQNDIIPNTVSGQYDISRDREYIKVNYSDSSVKLYNYIKTKAISTFRQFNHTRHAIVENTKISKDGRRVKMLDLSDTGGDLTLAIEGIKKLRA